MKKLRAFAKKKSADLFFSWGLEEFFGWEEQHGEYDGCSSGAEEPRDVRYQEILQHRGE